MPNVLDHSKPYFRFFEEISAIPRNSGDERAVSEYIVDFARERGLRHRRDAINNVVIEKDASPGYEGAAPVILQGHTDMVCVKREGVEHDFATEPLKLRVEDGWLRAEGTSLGSDDACGVAAMLYILDDPTLEHPPLECVFTVEEESGMGGAAQFDYSSLRGRRMVGLDAKDEAECLVATAGGRRFTLSHEWVPEQAAGTVVTLSVSGLVGGHPGVEIHKGGANAVKVVARILDHLRAHGVHIRLAQLDGGDAGNAIPGASRAAFVADGVPEESLRALLAAAVDAQTGQRTATDPDMLIEFDVDEQSRDVMSHAVTAELCAAILLIPSGVLQMSPTFAGAVQTSCNLAAVHAEAGETSIIVSTRSSVEAQLDDVVSDVVRIARLFGFDAEAGPSHPALSFRPVSPFRDSYAEAMRELWGKDIDMLAAHAGVELGYFAANLPGLETVALGPYITGAHTFDEAMEVASFERVCLFLAGFLRRLQDAR
ncbi:beta-Ala-His dipeptidase [Microbacterium sp. SSM24]|uniref:beta-Ala-His dipeptidase n=1 Tax=Microbacterium sp. SSM24 TaxID=2991714 RepID=UPI0022268A36|nr:beta-Ala-His dipeptidase [Microbacterium sp. SSM24]MCW3492610.1 beta-Ala-His dipeptidase [Microbacterium sp. SSM24]